MRLTLAQMSHVYVNNFDEWYECSFDKGKHMFEGPPSGKLLKESVVEVSCISLEFIGLVFPIKLELVLTPVWIIV